MAPPKPRPKPTRAKKVMDEDDYVEALDAIIGRDYFPNVQVLKDLMTAAGIRIRGDLDDLEEEEGEVQLPMSLSQFVAKHTSEDNESFHVILEKDQEDHRRRYWWAFDEGDESDKGKGGDGQARLRILPNGQRNEGETRKKLLAALQGGVMRGDVRPNSLEMWKHRTRNQLHFPPELEDSNDTCKLSTTHSGVLLLEGEKKGGKGRGGVVPKAPRVIQSHATRITHADAPVSASADGQSPYELPASERSSVADFMVRERAGVNGQDGANQKMVPMTPSPLPGVAESPIMTWGAVGSTPVLLRGAGIGGPGGGFHVKVDPDGSEAFIEKQHELNFCPCLAFVQAQPTRERIAHRLDSEKRSGKKMHSQSPAPYLHVQSRRRTTTSNFPRSVSYQPEKGTRTPSLTPAAMSLARKLAKQDKDKKRDGKKQQGKGPSLTDGLLHL
ncbi:unnamed protein product [Chrysoparadoxa australica]